MSIEQEKRENQALERLQAKLYTERMKSDRKYFQYADVSQSLLETQKEDDLHLLQESFMKWIVSMKKDDTRKDELTLLLKSIWRIQSYCGSLETVCKSATVSVHSNLETIKRIESEKRLLELEIQQLKIQHEQAIKSLKAEIEFTQKTS